MQADVVLELRVPHLGLQTTDCHPAYAIVFFSNINKIVLGEKITKQQKQTTNNTKSFLHVSLVKILKQMKENNF